MAVLFWEPFPESCTVRFLKYYRWIQKMSVLHPQSLWTCWHFTERSKIASKNQQLLHTVCLQMYPSVVHCERWIRLKWRSIRCWACSMISRNNFHACGCISRFVNLWKTFLKKKFVNVQKRFVVVLNLFTNSCFLGFVFFYIPSRFSDTINLCFFPPDEFQVQ